MKNLIVLVFVLMLTACAGSGGIEWDNVRQLTVGMTEHEVTEKVGTPYSVTSKSDGTEIWVWVHVNLLAGTETMSVIMKNGNAIQVPKVPDSFR